jgi:hypothetical protein
MAKQEKRIERSETKSAKGKVVKVETKVSKPKIERVVLTANGKPINLETKVSLNPAHKIKVLVENPYRPKSKKAIAFSLLKTGQTAAQALEKVASDRLMWAVRREFVKVG